MYGPDGSFCERLGSFVFCRVGVRGVALALVKRGLSNTTYGVLSSGGNNTHIGLTALEFIEACISSIPGMKHLPVR